MLKDGKYEQYGTYFHNRVFKHIKKLNIDGLEIDKNIYKPNTKGGKGNVRRPDFQWKPGTPEKIKLSCTIKKLGNISY